LFISQRGLECTSSTGDPVKNAGQSTAKTSTKPTVVGRSSSHFTRIVRLFAAELGVDYAFEVVPSLLAAEMEAYGGNPTLRVPILRTPGGDWFGALNICRELLRQSKQTFHMIWPEDLVHPAPANAQELASQAMATEVTLVMSRLGKTDEDGAYTSKLQRALVNSLAWLDEHAREALVQLPAKRNLSYLEVTLFCLVTHIEFRDVVPVVEFSNLKSFCAAFGERPSAKLTPFCFDS
jgi:glutathione S-transferase